MSIDRFVPETPKSLQEMSDYLSDPRKTTADSFIGSGVNPKNMVEEMQFVQDVYPQKKCKHPYVQNVFSFYVDIKLDMETL